MAAAYSGEAAAQEASTFQSGKDDAEKRARKEMRRKLRAELAAKAAAGLRMSEQRDGAAAEQGESEAYALDQGPQPRLARQGSLRSRYSSKGAASSRSAPPAEETFQGNLEFISQELGLPISSEESPTMSIRKRKTGNRLSSQSQSDEADPGGLGHGVGWAAALSTNSSSTRAAARDGSGLEDSATSTPPLEQSASPKVSSRRREGETKEEARRRRAARKAAKAEKAAMLGQQGSGADVIKGQGSADPLNLRGSASLAWGLGQQDKLSASQDLVLGMRKSSISSSKLRISLAHSTESDSLLGNSPSNSLAFSKRTGHAGPTGAWAMTSAGQGRQVRSAALEEELELLNADEDLDVQSFAPVPSQGGTADARQLGSAEAIPSMAHFGNVQKPGCASDTEMQGPKVWGEGLERYEAVRHEDIKEREAAAPPTVTPRKIEMWNVSGNETSARRGEDSSGHDSDAVQDPQIEAGNQPQEKWATRDGDAGASMPDDDQARAAHTNAMLMASHADVNSRSLSDICSRISFLSQAGPREGLFRMYIKRIKGLYGQYPTYECYAQDGGEFLLCARRRKKSQSSFYVISVDQRNLTRSSEGYIAKLRSNYVGTEYVGSNAGEPAKRNDGISHSTHSSDEANDPASEHIAIRYKQTVMTKNGGPRCMSAIVKDPSSMEVLDRTLVDLYKAAKVGNLNARERNSLFILRNKKPEWDCDINGYVLDFKGRVTEASVKNFQLARWQPGEDEPNGPVICQFGRNTSDTFALDFAYPLNVVQAFMIGLSSLDIKLCYSM